MEEKLYFIKNLEQFCKSSDACQRITLHHLDYIEFRGSEWLYIFVGQYGHNEKRINITGNSNEATVRAFFNALADWEEYPYLTHGNTFTDLLEV